ncbi:MAG: cell division protein FtsQ/DivIB [Candidatus Rokuibacteriota bacterium]
MLLGPRARPGPPRDVATRGALIARQRHSARRLARRCLRAVGGTLIVVLGLAAAGLAGVAAVHGLRTASWFAVREVEVIGARRLSEALVRDAAGIAPGTNLFAVDPETVEDRVEALAGVKSVRVVRRLPDRLAVVLHERDPYALVNAPGADALYWIDPAGHLVGREPHPGAPPLPILSGVELPGSQADTPVSDRLRVGLALLRAIQRTGDRAAGRISEIDLDQPEGPILYTVDGVAVRVGQGAWAERLARLEGVLGDLEERGERVEWIDLRFRDQVVLRPRPVTATSREAGAAAVRRPTTGTGGLSEAKERR